MILGDNVELALYEGGHVFTRVMRERSYLFPRERLASPPFGLRGCAG